MTTPLRTRIAVCASLVLLAACQRELRLPPTVVEHTDSPGEASAFYLQKRLAPEMGELPIETLLADPKAPKTRDIGGTAGTREVGEAIAALLK